PDETTARLVTQVLSELDFTVEAARESFAAVERLSEDHFHALVVDCQNEQDASLLFKAARNSEHNAGSLSVAVVEGQAGVAKAFRIGANLVLTKPINVEQSKSTLRVARGLLKKAQPKPAGTTPFNRDLGKPAETISPKRAVETPGPVGTASVPGTVLSDITKPVSAMTVTPAASVPYSGLILENDPEPVTEAADAAVLDSLPQIAGVHSVEPGAPALLGRGEPATATTAGQGSAAAAALAPEVKPTVFRPAGASPMVTNEPIVSKTVTIPAPVVDTRPYSAPSFSSLEVSGRSSGGRYILKFLLVLALFAGGYFAWQQPKVQDFVQQILHRGSSVGTSDPVPGDSHTPDQSTTSRQPAETRPPASDAQIVVAPPPTASEESNFDSLSMSHSTSQKPNGPESIEVQELPISRDAAKITVTPKVEPIVVRNAPAGEKPTQAAPPPVAAVADGADAKLPELTPVNIELPKPAPGTVRISQGVSQGLLLKKVQPAYPPIAKQFGRDGTVQLLATINKNGEIKKVQVLGGDALLAKAAVDAVRQWEYRPYLLNGQPVEIETQITIVFRAK
ncbi:MAG TPA: TonB family protein, partial [Terriglobales bacterium]|nr:TonB family protein [Terriglobales bacterium]